MALKRGYGTIGGYNKKMVTASGRVLKYNRSAAVKGSSRYGRKFAKSKARLGLSQKSVSNLRIGGFMGIELKYVDYGLVATALVAPTDAAGGEADPATALCLNTVAQGDSESQRDGRQIMCKSCYVTGSIRQTVLPDQPDALQDPVYYVALVLDTQTNGAQLNSEDVFTNPGANAILAPYVLRDMQYTNRFRVLDSCQLQTPNRYAFTDGASTGSISGTEVPWKLSWNGELPTNFTGTTAVVANVQDNSLHIIAYTSSTTGAPVISYNSRVRYVG